MKKAFLVALLAGGLSATAIAQSAADTHQVEQAVEALRKAMIDPDSAKLASLTADQLMYGHSGGHIEGKQEFIQTLLSGRSDFVTIDLSEQEIRIVNNTAIVHHILNAANNDGGKPGQIKLGIMTTWIKEKGKWKLLARQAVHV